MLYSEQEAVNLLYNGSLTGGSLQAVINRQSSFSDHQYSFQSILNQNLDVPDGTYSTQEALWLTLEADLNLTGSHFQYTTQELLNMALGEGDITLPEVIDDNAPYNGLLLAIAYT